MSKVVKAVVKNIVPIVVGAAVGALFPPAGMTFMAAFTRGIAIATALTAATALVTKTPKMNLPKATVTNRGREQQFKQPITNREVIYGQVRTSGPMVFVETTDKNKYMHIVVMIAGHEVDSFGQFIINNQEVSLVNQSTDSNGIVRWVPGGGDKYEGKMRVKFHNGESDQKADEDLVNETSGWTNNHRLRGNAYFYVRLQFDADVYDQGVPNMSVVVNGKKLYDVRDSGTDFSKNPALAIYDYLTNSDYGLGCATSEIDADSFDTAADICDESVTLAGGGTQKRYEINGMVSTGAKPIEIIRDMVSTMGGNLVYSGGKWVLHAGAYRSPSKTITADNIISELSIQTRASRSESFNAVKGIFISPDADWQPTDYPPITSSTFVTEDGGDTRYVDMELPMTTNSAMAQRLAKIALYRARQQVGVSFMADASMIDVRVGDTVSLTLDRYGWSAKTFEVMSYALQPAGENIGVELSLKEISSSVFDWDAEETTFQQDNTSLQSIFDVDPVGLTVTDEIRSVNETPTGFLIAEVSSGASSTQEFEVQAKKTTDSEYVNLGRASGNRFELANVEDGIEYDVRARGINSLGIRSEYTNKSHIVAGKSAAPSDVTGFSVNIVGENAHLSWVAVDDADLSHYKIRHTPKTSGAKFSQATEIVRKVARPANTVIVPAMTGTYFIKAVDKLGNSSESAASSIALINSISTENIVQTITESTAFSGSKSNVSVVSNKLQLDASYDEGFYNFITDTDLGAKYQCRLKPTVEYERLERSGLFDSQSGNFDDRGGLFDGTSDADFEDIDVELQFRRTDDDPSGTPTWSDWEELGLIVVAARAFQFRVQLTADSSNYSPQITKLEVEVDMPDRTIASADVSSGAAAKAITFSPAFKSLSGLAITAQDMATGDYYEITSKSATGFTITFKNSSGTAVDRTFDWVARGYGEVIT